MKPIQQTVRFSIEADGQMQTGITQEVTLEWWSDYWVCQARQTDYTFTGKGDTQTAAILDWLADRLSVK